ncbi:succinylglutamate-semialdehyde dehydrogenase [Mucisphaera sp.]|uniref:succinylglutamate-semialdehyde dehydrogenase n=1 Tax=Mucisphaera sp. TaxID=2913024 RepID=UPI003D0FB11B
MSAEHKHFINSDFVNGQGKPITARDPWTLEPTWLGHAASAEQVDEAVRTARKAQPAWSATPLENRIVICQRFAQLAAEHAEALTEAVASEAGKPRWEAAAEVGLIGPKVETSIAEHHRQLTETTFDLPNAKAVTRHRSHGVLAVIGPFNFPVHLPNGHIVPALLAGNTIVFKPSERTPSAGILMAKLWADAGLPPGVLSAIVGARETGEALVAHPQIDGVLFTGSYNAGRAIAAKLIDEPGKIVALELGGNNAIVVDKVANLDAAAYTVAVSAFSTAGQRCNCARRLILTPAVDRQQFLNRLIAITQSIKIGHFDEDPQPFTGPLISPEAGQAILDAQASLENQNGTILEPVKQAGDHTGILRPGIIDAANIDDLPDEEHFGPLLRVLDADNLDHAMTLANQTRYGLAASLLTDNVEDFNTFVHTVRAGVINLNGPTVGASGKMPFGGIGRSGNHRPSAAAAAAYCAFPVASMQAAPLQPVTQPMPGIKASA